jgi:CheY-like chemotaxis protein/two-component sensor histidine kinase
MNNQRKDEFLAMLAHELRHPLTPISHAIHMLRLTDSDPATAALYETIDTETRRLVRYVNDLLDVVRVSRGLLEITRERLDLVKVVQQAVASIQPLVHLHRHSLTLALASQPIFVEGDADRLIQVVTNLLENALMYTEAGGQITLTLEQQGAQAVLSVRDSGVGIAAEKLAGIFELFERDDSGLSRNGGGLGLGLSVVRRVVELHGGRVEARSGGRGAGSEFVIWLPIASPSERPALLQEGPAKTSSPGAVPHTRKVLLVDDREEVTKSLRRLVGSWGHEVAVAWDADSALTVAAGFQPDCAIVDLSLPRVTGYELARRLREAFPIRPLLLIAFTGHGNDSVRERCRAAGFDACLVKPGDIDTLRVLLNGLQEPS